MSAQFDLGWVYGVSPLVTFRMMTRLEHLTEKARQLGYEDFHVLELRERAGVFRQVSEREAADIMPARRFFGGRSMMTETLAWQQPAWSGQRQGDYNVELSAAPQVTVVGQLELTPAGTVGTGSPSRSSWRRTGSSAARAGRSSPSRSAGGSRRSMRSGCSGWSARSPTGCDAEPEVCRWARVASFP